MSMDETTPIASNWRKIDIDEANSEKLPITKKGSKDPLGGSTITFWGSVILTLNNVMGPAMVSYPFLYRKAGWISSSVILIAITVISSFTATMLCEAMQRIPGNHNFQMRFEFATTIKHYWGQKMYIAGQILLNICLQANNIASIIVSAQIMDDCIISIIGHSYGIEFAPHFGFVESHGSGADNPFDSTFILSLGYLICMLICIPFGYLNLDENMWFQWFSVVALLSTTAEFIMQYIANLYADQVIDDLGRSPSLGTGIKGQALVLGVIVFSFAYVITVPSWVNEKRKEVSTNKPIWIAGFVGMLLKLLVGYLGALAYKDSDANILRVMTHSTTGWMKPVTTATVYIFNLGTIIPGIPVFSILVRYNLIMGKVCGPKIAFFVGVCMPWLVSMWFYQGSGFSHVINWSAIIFQGFVNFIIPALLFCTALKKYPLESDRHLRRQRTSLSEDNPSSLDPNVQSPREGTLTNRITIEGGTYVNAVPSFISRWISPYVLAISITVIMSILVTISLALDFFYLIFRGEDLVD